MFCCILCKRQILMLCDFIIYIAFWFKIKSVAYSSQGSHTGQLDFCTWLVDDIWRDNVISIMLRQVYQRQLS